MTTMVVLGLSGGLRRDSYNRRLLEAAAAGLPRGVTFELYEGLADVTPYNEDTEKVGAAPEGVRVLREEISAADAVLISTPEYNASVPGHLKNALDWTSRPFPDNALRGKPVAVVGASTGTYEATAAELEGEERERVWGEIVASYPFFAEHEEKADPRRIPVVALEPLAG